MKYLKEPAQRIGWLFVVATVAGVLSVVVMSSTLGDDDLLAAVYSDQGLLILGEMLIFVMLAAMVGTAVLLAPVLRAHSEKLALSYVLARTLEVAVIAVGMITVLLLVPLSWDVAAADGGDMASSQVLAESLKTAGDWTGYLGAQMIFSISALVLNWAFLRNGLIPRWLSLWGLIGVPFMFASGLLVMFESVNSNASTLNLLVVPLAVQEMVMALWLIVKGFCDVTEHDPALEAPSGRITVRFRSWNGDEQQIRLARRNGQQFETRDEVEIIGDALGESAIARRCRFRFNLGEEPIPAARVHDARVSTPQQRSLGAGAPR